MIRYLSGKILSLILLFAVLTVMTVALQNLRHGDASVLLAGQQSGEKELSRLRRDLGVETGFGVRLARAAGSVFLFSFGKSLKGADVLPLVAGGLKHTAMIGALASLFALLYPLLIVPLSLRFGRLKKAADLWHTFLMANPVFLLAIALIWLFSLKFSVLPPGGIFLSGWMILPASALGLKAAARLSFFLEDFLRREEEKSYVLTHRAWGMGETRLLALYMMRNAALPFVSLWLVDLASYLSGAAIIETIHSIPGLGFLLLQSLHAYDINLLLGCLTVISLIIFAVGLLQDLAHHVHEKYAATEVQSER